MITSETLSALDREDPLGPFREQFELPEGVIYLDGNSARPVAASDPHPADRCDP